MAAASRTASPAPSGKPVIMDARDPQSPAPGLFSAGDSQAASWSVFS